MFTKQIVLVAIDFHCMNQKTLRHIFYIYFKFHRKKKVMNNIQTDDRILFFRLTMPLIFLTLFKMVFIKIFYIIKMERGSA